MAIQYIGTTISGVSGDTKPTLSANEKGVLFVETDTNKIYQWDTDSWNITTATDATTSAKGVASFSSDNFAVSSGAVTIKNDGVILGTETTGNYIATIAGTSNQIAVSGSGSETAGVTLSIPSNPTLPGNVTVSGDFTVSGDTTTVNTATLAVEDPLVSLATGNNSSDVVDIGIYGLYDTSGSQDLYGGFFRDASDGKWRLFKDSQEALGSSPTATTINVSATGYTVGTLVANLEGNVIGNVTGNTSGTAATVTGAAQTAITSVGTLSALAVGAITDTSDKTITISSDDGNSSAVIFGNNGDADRAWWKYYGGDDSPADQMELKVTGSSHSRYQVASNVATVAFQASSGAKLSTTAGALTIDGDDGIVLQTTGSGGVTIPTDYLSVGTSSTTTGIALRVDGRMFFEDNATNVFVMNSAGSDYGFVMQHSSDKWALGHGTSITSLGTPVLLWTDSGNVGIGTASPYELSGYTFITVNHATNGGGMVMTDNDTRIGAIYNAVNDVYLDGLANLIFRTGTNAPGGTERMRIASDGNVGIGGSGNAVDHELHIENSSSNSTPAIKLENDAQGYRLQVNGGDGDKLQLLETTGFDTFFQFEPSTKDITLGIDSNIVNLKGDVYIDNYLQMSSANSGAANKIHLNNTSADAGSAATIEVYVNGQNDSDAGVLFATTYSTNVYWKVGIDQSNSKSFTISNNGTFGTNDYFTINTSGNVGIGTTTPMAGIASNSTGKFEIEVSRSPVFDADDTSTWEDMAIHNTQNGAGVAAGIGFHLNTNYHSNAATGIAAVKASGDDYDADMVFITRGRSVGASEKMRIRHNGNVGIGITDPARTLHILEDTTDAQVRIAHDANYYLDISELEINMQRADASAGNLSIKTTNAGSWGSGGGNINLLPTGTGVGIGTADPDGTLHVHTASAGSVTANSLADDLVVENSATGGISILVPDNANAMLNFGSASDNYGAQIYWDYDSNKLVVGTHNAGDKIIFQTAEGTESVHLSGGATPTMEFQGATTLSTSTDVLTIDGDDGIVLQTTGSGNVTVNEILDITDATDASDATGDTGALRTEGGASIAKKLYVGTDLDVDGTAELDNITIGGAQGTDGQVLTSTGSGVAWEDAGGGGGLSWADYVGL